MRKFLLRRPPFSRLRPRLMASDAGPPGLLANGPGLAIVCIFFQYMWSVRKRGPTLRELSHLLHFPRLQMATRVFRIWICKTETYQFTAPASEKKRREDPPEWKKEMFLMSTEKCFSYPLRVGGGVSNWVIKTLNFFLTSESLPTRGTDCLGRSTGCESGSRGWGGGVAERERQ